MSTSTLRRTSMERISRRRAARACLKCRKRKVRCDVTRTSQPCSNCRYNAHECIVVPRFFAPYGDPSCCCHENRTANHLYLGYQAISHSNKLCPTCTNVSMMLCLLRSWNSPLQHPPLILPLLGKLLGFPHLPPSRRSTQSPKQRQICSITRQSIQTTSLHSFHTNQPVLKAIAGHLSELP